MSRGVAIAVVVAALARAAAAQPATKQQSDDLFGFGDKDKPAAADCADGTADACAFATDALAAKASPFALSVRIAAARWRDLPVADADHDAAVALALGTTRDPSGVAFAGTTGRDTRAFIEGAAADSVDVGGVDTRVPLLFVDAIRTTAGGFSAADRTSFGGTVDVALIRGGDHHQVDAEVWATAMTEPDALHPPLETALVTTTPDDRRWTSFGVTARGPIARVAGARLWYAAGVRPTLRDDGLVRDVRGLVDFDNDAMIDVGADGAPLTQPIDHRTYSDLAYRVPMLARIGAEGGHHAVELTALATPFRDTEWSRELGAESASGIHRRGMVFDGIATWRGTRASTRARVIASWHRSDSDERARTGDPDAVQIQGNVIPPEDDPVVAAACDDTPGVDPWPSIPQCRIGSYVRGGPGRLFGETDDRAALVADVAHRIGKHVVSAGVSAEDGRVDVRHSYSGGALVSDFGFGARTERIVEVATGPDTVPCGDNTTLQCRVLDAGRIRWRTRQLAAYVADEWRPRAEYAFSGGIRWESMELDQAFTFRDQVAPRFGFAWDPLGGGTSRVFASYGRAYALIPAATDYAFVPSPSLQEEQESAAGAFTTFFDGRSVNVVDPRLGPPVTEEVAGGAEVAISGIVRMTAWGQVRWLRRGLEDEFSAADDSFRLTNPRDPPDTRRTSLVALEVAIAPSPRFAVRAQYQYTRAIGATPGAFDDTLENTPYLTETYDLVRANVVGALPTDLRHHAAIEGTARFALGPVPVVVGLRAVATTGPPVNVLGADDLTDERFYLLPRGTGGRLGLVTSTNLHLAAGLGHGIALVVDVLNLFDRQPATAVDEFYTRARGLAPISGGTREDLVFLHANDDDGRVVGPEPTYGLPTARQAPLRAAVGVRARF